MYDNKNFRTQTKTPISIKSNNHNTSNSSRHLKGHNDITPQKSRVSKNNSVRKNEDKHNFKKESSTKSYSNYKSPLSNNENYQSVDIHTKISELTEEISNLKQKLSEVNSNNVHLQNMIQSKDSHSKGITDYSIHNQLSQESNQDNYVNDNNNPNTFSFQPAQQKENPYEDIIKECQKLKDVELEGVWSVDFLVHTRKTSGYSLKEKSGIYLIDMALAQDSTYWDPGYLDEEVVE